MGLSLPTSPAITTVGIYEERYYDCEHRIRNHWSTGDTEQTAKVELGIIASLQYSLPALSLTLVISRLANEP